MIIFDLVCDREHQFEGWFSSKADFDTQMETDMISCPICDSANVNKLPSAAHINVSRPADSSGTGAEMEVDANHDRQPAADLAAKIQDYMKRNFDNVDDEFVAEVRRIHSGESEDRNIMGTASREEIMELEEEGIETFVIPAKKDKSRLN